MGRFQSNLLLWIFVFGIDMSVKGDECSNSTRQLNSLTERVVGYNLRPDEKPINDLYLEFGWYSMKGYSLSSSPEKTCGTVVNWYMSGNLPQDTQIGTVTVCANDGSMCPGPFSKTIRVRKCGSENYVFELKHTDSSSEAYCIEPLSSIVPETPPSTPDISYIRPKIRPQIVRKTKTAEELEYFCDFILKPEDKRLYYTIEWNLSDGTSIAKGLHSGTATKDDENEFESKTKLMEDQLTFNGILKLGFTLICSVKAKDGIAGKYSHVQRSEPKFCGIQILTKQPVLIVKDNEKTDINVKLTVPFGCSEGNAGEHCTIDLLLFIPDDNKLVERCEVFSLASVHRTLKPCGVRFKHDEINVEKTLSFTNRIAGRQNKNLGQQFLILLQTISYKYHSMISDYVLDPIKVVSYVDTSKIADKVCYAHSDPHMKTFDGKRYENHAKGIFLLYRNTKYNTEVQVQTAPCSNYNQQRDSPYCNKAVAIRAGRDVYMVDLANHDINFKMCEDRIMKEAVRRRGSHTFKIVLPTGTEVHLRGTMFLEVDIKPALDDFNNSEGLCGNFDGNAKNDVGQSCQTTKANLCWRKDHAKFLDLFDKNERQNISSFEQELMLCSCECPKSGCNVELTESFTCSAKNAKTCWLSGFREMDNHLCSVTRSKRDIHSDFETNPDVEHNGRFANHITKDTEFEGHVRFRRTIRAAVVNETTARNQCRISMNTSSVQKCSSIPGFDVEPYLENCALDAMASNSMEWTQIHIEAIKKECINIVEFNQPIPQEVLEHIQPPSDPDNDTTDISKPTTWQQTFQFTPDLLRNIKDVSCINDCSGNGKCEKGVCVCDSGYFDDDCSVDISIAPTMYGIPDKGQCDLTQRECKRTAVMGGKFVDTSGLFCRLKPFKIGTDGQVTSGDPIKIRATYDSFLQVFCPLPATKRKRRSVSDQLDFSVASGYKIAVSNDGNQEQGFSAEDSIIIFDSTCVNCEKQNGYISCSTQPGYCVHNGRCYSKGDHVGCYSCLEHAPMSFKWTLGSDCSVLPTTDVPKKMWIIGATLGPAVAITLIVISVFIYRDKKRTLRKRVEAE